MLSDKTRILGLAILVWAILAPGCNDGPSNDAPLSSNRANGVGEVRESDDLDLGDDWASSADVGSRSNRPSSAPSSSVPGLAPGRTSYWSIVLRTFSNEGHETAGRTMLQSMTRIDPKLASAHLRTTTKGTKVLFGVYEGPDDRNAQRDLKWVKGLTLAERQVFPRAMLSRVRIPRPLDQIPEWDLMSLRIRYPRVDPLYTVQVAVWGDFGSGRLTEQQIRDRATAYAKALRRQGHEAYVHHDLDKGLSVVTVGHFDRTVYDPQSGLYSPDVLWVMKQFPNHLVNGEELQELIDPKRPRLGTRTQASKLMAVPELE